MKPDYIPTRNVTSPLRYKFFSALWTPLSAAVMKAYELQGMLPTELHVPAWLYGAFSAVTGDLRTLDGGKELEVSGAKLVRASAHTDVLTAHFAYGPPLSFRVDGSFFDYSDESLSAIRMERLRKGAAAALKTPSRYVDVGAEKAVTAEEGLSEKMKTRLEELKKQKADPANSIGVVNAASIRKLRVIEEPEAIEKEEKLNFRAKTSVDVPLEDPVLTDDELVSAVVNDVQAAKDRQDAAADKGYLKALQDADKKLVPVTPSAEELIKMSPRRREEVMKEYEEASYRAYRKAGDEYRAKKAELDQARAMRSNLSPLDDDDEGKEEPKARTPQPAADTKVYVASGSELDEIISGVYHDVEHQSELLDEVILSREVFVHYVGDPNRDAAWRGALLTFDRSFKGYEILLRFRSGNTYKTTVKRDGVELENMGWESAELLTKCLDKAMHVYAREEDHHGAAEMIVVPEKHLRPLPRSITGYVFRGIPVEGDTRLNRSETMMPVEIQGALNKMSISVTLA